jgi:DNA-binding transcriptional ArsR family regulator
MNDTESLILVALLSAPAYGKTVTELAEGTGVSSSTVRNHLRVMRDNRTLPWVYVEGWPPRWHLTMKGRDVAGYRRRG